MKGVLITPRTDLFVLGGGAIAFAVVALAMGAMPISAGQAWKLGLIFSFPHFTASYFIFYGKDGPWGQHRIVAWIVPLCLALALALGIAIASPLLIVGLAQLTLVLLYWHYLKQAFGITIWLGGSPEGDVAPDLKQGLLAVCLLLGMSGYLQIQGTPASLTFGLYTERFRVPDWAPGGSRWVALVGMGGLFAWWAILKWKKKSSLEWRGFIPILALWTWTDPIFDHTGLKGLLPVFHGAQYLPFPLRTVLNQRSAEAPSRRYAKAAVLFALFFAAGYLFFRSLPQALASFAPFSKTDRVFAFFAIFLNVHHYLIDSVVWRFRDSKVRARLISSS